MNSERRTPKWNFVARVNIGVRRSEFDAQYSSFEVSPI